MRGRSRGGIISSRGEIFSSAPYSSNRGGLYSMGSSTNRGEVFSMGSFSSRGGVFWQGRVVILLLFTSALVGAEPQGAGGLNLYLHFSYYLHFVASFVHIFFESYHKQKGKM